MRALSVGAFALLAFATSSRAQVVSPDDGPAPPTQPPPPQYPQQPNYPATQQNYAAPQQYSAPPGYVLVPAAQPMSEQELAALESRGRTLRAVGAVLIALGAAADIAGLAIIIDYYSRSAFDGSHGWEPYASLGLGLGSAALLGAGIPLLSAGIRDVRHAKRVREGRVAFSPTAVSVTF
ncbi:MAG TPA: hypothetical protein VFF06_36755 [Polyangia bacterium]|nr:hypothetical protein [Polyangia bacterium]